MNDTQTNQRDASLCGRVVDPDEHGSLRARLIRDGVIKPRTLELTSKTRARLELDERARVEAARELEAGRC